MRITKLTAQNFKGWSGSMDLAPVTLIRGRNSRGKSARLQALWLALSGAMPGEGKDNQAMNSARAIYDAFASGAQMEVGIEFKNNTFQDRRTLILSMMNGSVKQIGGTLGIDTLDLNAVELLSRPGPERTRLLLERSGSGGDAQAVKDKLCDKIHANWLEVSEPPEGFVPVLREYYDSIQQCDEPDVLKAFEAIEAMLAEQKKLADQQVKRLEQTGQGLAQMAQGEAPPQDAEQRLQAARREHEAAVQARATAQAAHEQAKRELEAAEASANTHHGFLNVPSIAELEAALAELEAHPAPDPGPQKPTADVRYKAEQDFQAVSREEYERHRVLNTLAEQLDGEVLLMRQHIDERKSAKTCSECGQSIKRDPRLIAKMKKELAARERAGKSDIGKATAFLGKCITQREDADAVLQKANAACEAWSNAALAYHRWSEARHKLKDQLQAAKDAISSSSRAQQAAAEAKAALPELERKVELRRGECIKAQTELKLAEEAVAAAEGDYRKLLAWRAEQSSKAKAAQALKSARAEAAVAKAALDACRELSAETLEAAIKPVIAACNRLCEPILPGPAFFADGEFGMEVGGRKVGYKAASDSEKLMLCAALGVALASKAPLRLFTLGRFESFDYEKKPKLIGLLCDLVRAEELDQALLIEVSSEKDAPDLEVTECRTWGLLETVTV